MVNPNLAPQPQFPAGLVNRTASRLRKVVTNITIEPAMFLIALSNALDDNSIKKMQIYKSCKVDFGLNDTVCDNLLSKNFTVENDMVQDEIAQFSVYQDIVTSFLPIFFSFYLGAWCDMFGRKLCMFLFLSSKCVGQSVLIVTAYFIDLPKEWILLTVIPTTLIGGYAAFGIGISAFIADISHPDQRAFRMAMIHLAQSCGRTVGIKLGAILLDIGGYIGVTAASLSGVGIGAIFLSFRMRNYVWKRPDRQYTRHPFSLYHIKDALMVTFKRRPQPNMKYLYLLMAMMIIQIIPGHGEGVIAFLYVRTRYGWDVDEYSNYGSIVSTAGIVAQALIIPTLSMLKVRDTLICMVVLTSAVVRHLIKGFSSESWMYYLAAFVDLIGSYSSSLIRAMLTCCAPLNEFGKIYAVISAIDNILPTALTQAYASLWQATSETYPGAGFLLSAGFSTMTLSIAAYIHYSLRGQRFSEAVRTEELEKEGNRDDYEKSIFELSAKYDEAVISQI